MDTVFETGVHDFTTSVASSTLAEVNAQLASSSASTTVHELMETASSTYAQVASVINGFLNQEEGWFAVLRQLFAFFGG